jgi:hypothetical protein
MLLTGTLIVLAIWFLFVWFCGLDGFRPHREEARAAAVFRGRVDRPWRRRLNYLGNTGREASAIDRAQDTRPQPA